MLTAAFSDSHREDYLATYGARFLLEAESLIRKRLEYYFLTYTLQDADRITVLGPVYNLPAGSITLVRHLFRSDGFPMDQTDETVVNQYSTASVVLVYAVRPTSVIVAGTPGAGDTMTLHYFGMPAPLVADGDSNSLLNDHSDLYKEAVMVSIYKRARDFDAATAFMQSCNSTIDEINRKMKKLLGGARSSNPYNVAWRSSY
jgi:hypothetical protein